MRADEFRHRRHHDLSQSEGGVVLHARLVNPVDLARQVVELRVEVVGRRDAGYDPRQQQNDRDGGDEAPT